MHKRERAKLPKTIIHFMRKLGMDKKLNAKLEKIKEEFDKRTADVEDFWDLSDFLRLLELAEYGYLGKTKAIIYAFKVGYLAGRERLKNRILEHFCKEGD